jgi:MFS family permease
MQTSMLARVSQTTQAFSALKYRDFRFYWSGLLVSVSGFQIVQLAQGWLIYDLTGEAKFLGYLGLVTAMPTIILNLYGGVVADRVNQLRLIQFTQGASALLFGLLGVLILLNLVAVWHVLVIALCSGALLAFDSPSRMALFPHLIDRKVLMNAVALNSLVWQSTRIVGPTLAGLLIAVSGLAAPFFLAALCFLAMVSAMRMIHPPAIPRHQGGNVFQDLAEAARFVLNDNLFKFLIGMTFFNSFFGMSYVMLLPVFARNVLNVGALETGLLLGASGVGAVLVLMFAVTRANSQKKGLYLIGGAALFGILLIAFSVSRSFHLSLLLLFLAGGSSTLYMIMVQTTLQAQVPDRIRGRVMGIYGMTWSLLPLGAMQSGFLADLVSPTFAVGLGGIAVTFFALGAVLLNPDIRNLGLNRTRR